MYSNKITGYKIINCFLNKSNEIIKIVIQIRFVRLKLCINLITELNNKSEKA